MITLEELKALDNHMFDREIALLLGWTVDTEEKMYDDGFYDFPIFDYVIADQRGEVQTYWEDGVPNTTQKRAWEHCCLPRFSADLNVAWDLCEGAVNFTVGGITTMMGLPLARADVRSKDVPISTTTPVYREFHAQPARALATAWAAWKLA